MSTEHPEPADSSISDQVTGAEMRMQQALADIYNGVSWSNDKKLARPLKKLVRCLTNNNGNKYRAVFKNTHSCDSLGCSFAQSLNSFST